MSEIPKTIEELCDYIIKYADCIYVREKVKDKWKSYSLIELPQQLAIQHALRFVKEGHIPVRLKREDEL